jgi:formylglycine-generating enzyme
VNKKYQIGKYEITYGQWIEFLNAKASVSDSYGLYNTEMAGIGGGIDRSWSEDHYVYGPKGGDDSWNNRPVNYVSFWDAARFCNWLHNGQGNGDTESGAYINIGNQNTFVRQTGAKYFIPTENEWYKAAYYYPNKPGGAGYWGYPTRSDTRPINTHLTPDPGNHANFLASQGEGTGGYTVDTCPYTTPVGAFEKSASAYGTYDQGGNIWEWTETRVNNVWAGETGQPRRVGRGGGAGYSYNGLMASFRYGGDFPTYEGFDMGFRIASVPEPSALALLGIGAIGLLGHAWRRRKSRT